MSEAAVRASDDDSVRARMRAMFERVEATCDLPPLPAVAMQAMNLVRDPDVTAEQLSQLVATDVAIAARVLRLSRSALYLRRTAPRTLQEAIVTVGFDSLRKILIVASARSAYDGRDETVEALWMHSLATALAADELAVAAGERRGGTSFIAGLLHDVGELVFHLSHRQAFATLGTYDEEREVELFGVPHAAVAGCLAEQWGLDDELVEAVTFHHHGTMSPLAARIERADRLAHEIGYGSVARQAAVPSNDPEFVDLGARVLDTFERERALFS